MAQAAAKDGDNAPMAAPAPGPQPGLAHVAAWRGG
jgi:hypothetical protein